MSYVILRQIPNLLTVCRLLLIFPFLMGLYYHDYAGAFYLYIVAGLTDCLDGWLARHYNWNSALGSFLDPLADKLLISTSFISLALLEILPWWLVALVFMRDLTISVGVMAWYFFIHKELDFKPTLLSKINTTLQLVLVTLCLFQLAFFNLPSTNYIMLTAIYLTALTTAATYFNYVWIWGQKAYLYSQMK